MEIHCKICPNCENLENKLNEKEKEIQKVKLQIRLLTDFLQSKNYNIKCNSSLNLVNTANTEFNRREENAFCSRILEVPENSNTFVGNAVTIEEQSSFTITRNFQTQTDSFNTFCEGCLSTNGNNLEDKNHETHISTSNIGENSGDYVYDENSKMYYSHSTGYYYDENKGLLFEPRTGTYYKYDYSKQEYELVTNDSAANSEFITGVTCESVADKVSGLNLNDDDIQHTEDTVFLPKEIEDIEVKNSKFESAENSETENVSLGSTKDWQPPEGTDITVSDLVREVVESHDGLSDYIYDECSHMYYSPSTGYYYDAVKKLLYEPSSGIYYQYDTEKQTYEFYGQAVPSNKALSESNVCTDEKIQYQKSRRSFWRKKLECIKNSSTIVSESEPKTDENNSASNDEFSSPEDGEIFSSDSDSENCPVHDKPRNLQENENSSEVWPPCIRAIVESSEKLKIGTLLLITCTGGIIGREKSNAVCIPDVGVSKLHAEIKYCNESWKYSIEDLGSQNGTFVNELRLSLPKEKSEPQILNHGDKLSLGSCKLLLHIHNGFETCDECEPGQVLAGLFSQDDKHTIVFKTKEEKEKERKQELRKLKKKYGLEGMAYINGNNCKSNNEYEDKAEIRRRTVGSQNPYEKTEESSIDNAVPATNKGYQLLKKMGWKEGQKLGAAESGILEPIPLRPWTSKAGLGSRNATTDIQSFPEDKRKKKWVQAQERYFRLT